MKDDLYYLWLTRIADLPAKKKHLLIQHFQSPAALFDAPAAQIRSVPWITEHMADEIINSRDEEGLLAYKKNMDAKNIRFISFESAAYPVLLKEIYDPPLGLYVLGELPDESIPHVAVIGSRTCSEYGITAARTLSYDLAYCGLVIVSGMARGIDGVSHRAAIDAGGLTVAVLGCGVDICYPAENSALRDEIIRHGCVVSEYPVGKKAAPMHFPARNRIISGLSNGLVVVEAAKKSGTLITVNQALDQNKDVMAVPGNITSKLSVGTNDLIKQGAGLVASYQDVLAYMEIDQQVYKFPEESNTKTDLLAPEEKVLYDMINFEPIGFEEIISKTKGDRPTVTYMLTKLELMNLVQRMPGQRYIRSFKRR